MSAREHGYTRLRWCTLVLSTGLALLLLSSCSNLDQHQAELPTQGTVVTHSIVFARYQIPLPEGQWTIIGRRVYRNRIGKINAETLLIKTTVNEFNQSEISELVSISGNVETGSGGFENICSSAETADNVYTQTNSARLYQQDCWGINHLEMSFSDEQIEQNQDLAEAREYVRSHQILVPINMVYAKHRFADASQYLTLWRFFNPDLEGIPQTKEGAWEQSDWHKNNIGGFPQKLSYIETIKERTRTYHEWLRSAFENQ